MTPLERALRERIAAEGPITVEAFFTAIPYKNSIVTADMTGQ